jgi:hypothetical protein
MRKKLEMALSIVRYHTTTSTFRPSEFWKSKISIDRRDTSNAKVTEESSGEMA